MSDPSLRLEISRIKERDDLPVPPELSNNITPMRGKLKLIQAYITSLEYNYTGEEYFVKKKDRGFRHVTSTAKLIIREALPIQCVEAVFIGAYLTADMAQVDRFPVCFRSSLDGRVYRHIILAVRSGKVWGALGLSRRDTLMYKELRYELFSELMGDFRDSYAGSWHRLEHIWVGFPLPHDISSNVPVKWKVMRANVGTDAEWSSAAPDLDSFVACASTLFERFSTTGMMPDHPLLSSSGSASNDGQSSALPPPSAARHGDGDAEAGEGRADPRESPGARSPGVRSPGFPPYWLGPGSGEVGRGGRRRMSMPVGQVTARENKSSGGSGGGQGIGRGNKPSPHSPALSRRGGGGDDGGSGGGGGNVGTTFIASPPRARTRSAVAGVVRAAARGGALARKPRRRISRSKEGAGEDSSSPGVSGTALAKISPPSGTTHKNDVTAISATSATPKRLPV